MERISVSEGTTKGVVFVPDLPSDRLVVVLPGSGGGIPDGYAQRLAERGLIAFALAYFGVEGLPSALEEVPVEIVEGGISLCRSRFGNDGRVGILGSSKGAELALLVASRLPEAIDSVVGVAPSSVVWYGLGGSGLRSSWSWQGQPVPFLPLKLGAHPSHSAEGMRVDHCYELSGYRQSEIDAATIEVERCGGPILLLSGSDDHMSPSATMAELMEKRVRDRAPDVRLENIVYPGAGHAFLHREFFSNADDMGKPIWDFGGTADADEEAARDAWPRITSFLAGKR